MKLEQQVTSLEISKKLKELGVKQESLFYWERMVVMGKTTFLVSFDNSQFDEIVASAFTVAELGEILSEYKQGIMPSFNSNFDHGWYYKDYGWTVHERTEADARGKMLIYLLEHNLIKND